MKAALRAPTAHRLPTLGMIPVPSRRMAMFMVVRSARAANAEASAGTTVWTLHRPSWEARRLHRERLSLDPPMMRSVERAW
jgi:hypothetical protein